MTPEHLRAMLRYEPATGVFRCRVRPARYISQDAVAGTTDANGFRIITVAGAKFMAARLAWLFSTGRWPSAYLAFRDGNRDNNAFRNLRLGARATSGRR